MERRFWGGEWTRIRAMQPERASQTLPMSANLELAAR